MKKIVGILAAAGVMAASIFAADVSAAVGVASTLFSVTSEKDTSKKDVTTNTTKLNVFDKIGNNKGDANNPLFSLSVSSDVAGGGVKYWGNNIKYLDDKSEVASGAFVSFGAFNVWFKPMDGLKFSFMENGLGLFADKYNGWEAHSVASVGAGYGVEYAINGLTFNFNIVPAFMTGNFVKETKKDDVNEFTVGEFGLKAAYAADFGSIAAIVQFNNGKFFDKNEGEGEGDFGKYIDKNFNSFMVGAGYSGNIAGAVDLVGTVGFKLNDGYGLELKKEELGFDLGLRANKLLATVSAGGNIDAFGWAVCVPATFQFLYFPTNADLTISGPVIADLGLQVSASYNISGIGLKAYFTTDNLLAHHSVLKASEVDAKNLKLKEDEVENYFKGEVGVEVTGNVGIASWKVTPKVSFDNSAKNVSKTDFSIAFETGISF